MIAEWQSAAAVVAAIGCGLIGGVFFAFSTFVMKALDRLPATAGIAAMQAINITVLNPFFLVPFVGTAGVCALLAASTVLAWQPSRALWLLAGSLAYLVGTFVVTIACNVPRNDRLAKLSPESAASEAEWRTYVRDWTAWNHVRTAAALAAAVALTVAWAR